MSEPDTASRLIEASRRITALLERVEFSTPVAYVYNPLSYARERYEEYLVRYAGTRKRVVFMGMNPGPWGMAQTGIPFGEIDAVRSWLGIHGTVGRPSPEHPSRRVEGFACGRSEVSGRRLWGLFRELFGTAEAFSAEHFVANYCPLAFLEESGRNRTPDKLGTGEREILYAACDSLLAETIETLEPEWIVGIGNFAADRARKLVADRYSHRKGAVTAVGSVLHPSPASPAANRGWAEKAAAQLRMQGIWT